MTNSLLNYFLKQQKTQYANQSTQLPYPQGNSFLSAMQENSTTIKVAEICGKPKFQIVIISKLNFA